MTANPPQLRIETARNLGADTATKSRPEVLSELEKIVYPSWLDDDPAADGPNYLGYTMLMLPIFLLAMLALFAAAMV